MYPNNVFVAAYRRQDGPAFDCVIKGNAEGLLQCWGLDLKRDYQDLAHRTSVTLLGLSILKNEYSCMRTLLWLGANPDDICASFGFEFLQCQRHVNLTARELCKTDFSANIVLHLYELHRALLNATQWCIANMPAEWRDLAEGILIRLRHA
jgi:hypothetical protein